MTTALIDADIFLYQASAAVEEAVNWEGDIWSLFADLAEAICYFEFKLAEVAEEVGTDKFLFALSSHTNFRKEIYPDYKANRKNTRKPVCYQGMVDYLFDTYGEDRVYRKEGLEADDVLGILATHPSIIEGDKIIVSDDKDLTTVPCTLYKPKNAEWHTMSEQDANTNHLLQALTGDKTDGYSGCPGMGPVKSVKLLDGLSYDKQLEAYFDAYEEAGISREDALTQARLARILRSSDYSFKTKTPILWSPECS